MLELGACGDVRTLLRVKKSECYARECKARRAARMLILKRKREQGLISFETKVRYKQRSEMALKRDRCSGRFLSDIEYIDVNWCVCFTAHSFLLLQPWFLKSVSPHLRSV